MKPSERSIVFDAIIVAGALAFLFAAIVFGDYCARTISGPLIFPEALAQFYWLGWGARIVCPITGEVLCGFVLGRYLTRVRPALVIAAVGVYLVCVMAVLLTFVNPDRKAWIEVVGFIGAVTQMVLQSAAMLAFIWLGAWFGRKQRIAYVDRPASVRAHSNNS